MVSTPTKPRRFRFGLRTLFVLVTMAAIPFAWVGYSLNWVRQRREALANGVHAVGDDYIFGFRFNGTGLEPNPPRPRAPAGLWLLGARGNRAIIIYSDSESERERIARLFPEATVFQSYFPPGGAEVVKDSDF